MSSFLLVSITLKEAQIVTLHIQVLEVVQIPAEPHFQAIFLWFLKKMQVKLALLLFSTASCLIIPRSLSIDKGVIPQHSQWLYRRTPMPMQQARTARNQKHDRSNAASDFLKQIKSHKSRVSKAQKSEASSAGKRPRTPSPSLAQDTILKLPIGRAEDTPGIPATAGPHMGIGQPGSPRSYNRAVNYQRKYRWGFEDIDDVGTKSRARSPKRVTDSSSHLNLVDERRAVRNDEMKKIGDDSVGEGGVVKEGSETYTDGVRRDQDRIDTEPSDHLI